jgi:hypothetical protein
MVMNDNTIQSGAMNDIGCFYYDYPNARCIWWHLGGLAGWVA